MLHAISVYNTSPLAALVRPLLQDAMLTSAEVAAHWRQSADYMANMRRAGRGPAWLKLPHGAVRYRASDLIAYELAGQHGVTPAVVRLAIESLGEYSAQQRERLAERILRACYPNIAL